MKFPLFFGVMLLQLYSITVLADCMDCFSLEFVKIKTKKGEINGHVVLAEAPVDFSKTWTVYQGVLSFESIPVMKKDSIITVKKDDFISLEKDKVKQSRFYMVSAPTVVDDTIYDKIKNNEAKKTFNKISFTNYPEEYGTKVFHALSSSITYRDLFLLQIDTIYKQSNGNQYGNKYPLEFPKIFDQKAEIEKLKELYNLLLKEISIDGKECKVHTCVDPKKLENLLNKSIKENVLTSSYYQGT